MGICLNSQDQLKRDNVKSLLHVFEIYKTRRILMFVNNLNNIQMHSITTYQTGKYTLL